MTPPKAVIFEFGAFRLDAEQKLLFRDGKPVPLTPKALETLLALVEHSGRLVTKEDLMKRVWPNAFVEESNLTFNISQVRKALGDERNNGNRFIETIPRRGYRFIAPLNSNESASHIAPIPTHVTPSNGAASSAAMTKPWSISRIGYGIAALALMGLIISTFEMVRPLAPPRVIHSSPLTHDGREKGPLFTDGPRVYFAEKDGDRMTLVYVSAQGGAVLPAPMEVPNAALVGISADQSVKMFEKGDGSLWTVGPPSGLPRHVGEIVDKGGRARWSTDMSRIAYSDRSDLYVANSDGSKPRKLISAPGDIFWIRWSPDSKLLRFSVSMFNAEFLPISLWEVGSDGSNLHPVLPGWHEPPSECCGDWTPDGRYYLFQSPTRPDGIGGEIWAIREKRGWVRSQIHPLNLTSGPISFEFPMPSQDGKRVFALGVQPKGELVEWDWQRKEFVPYMNGRPAFWLTFSPDKKWIGYVDYTTNTLWRMKADGTKSQQLTFEPLHVDCISISPDNKTIAFRGFMPDKHSKIYVMPSTGGTPQLLLPELTQEQGFPTWSPDSRKIVFGDVPQKFGVDDGTHVIHIYDFDSHQLSFLPGSNGLWTSRWSPDGRYICAVTINNKAPLKQDLQLYDIKTKTWSDLHFELAADPVWSHDSKYLYVRGVGNLDLKGIFRVRISDGQSELIAPYGNLPRAEGWMGLTPDDSPMLLRNLSSAEVYALDVDWH